MHSSIRTRISNALAGERGLLPVRSGQGTRNRRKTCQEIVQTFPALQIIEEILDRHPGAPKDRDTMHRFSIPHDCANHAFHCRSGLGAANSIILCIQHLSLPNSSFTTIFKELTFPLTERKQDSITACSHPKNPPEPLTQPTAPVY